MKKYILLLIPAVLALWSCSKELSADMAEAASDELIEVSFSATLAETKAELQADGKVFWTTGDAIGVYDGSALRKFTLSSGAGTTSAVFSGSIASSATKVEAVYPYSAAALQDVAFDALNLNIGQDGTGSMSYHLPAQVDDMIITADVLTATDIAAIKSFYK